MIRKRWFGLACRSLLLCGALALVIAAPEHFNGGRTTDGALLRASAVIAL
jgi:hypothetical protein